MILLVFLLAIIQPPVGLTDVPVLYEEFALAAPAGIFVWAPPCESAQPGWQITAEQDPLLCTYVP